jgi:hypothetical protein
VVLQAYAIETDDFRRCLQSKTIMQPKNLADLYQSPLID